MSATALGLARFRPRRTRVRREPIDLELLAAEFAETAAAPVARPVERNEQEILRALEVEVERVKAAGAVAPEVAPEVAMPVEVAVAPEVAMPTAPLVPVPRPTTSVGLPLDQVQAWLDQVDEDLRKVQARVEYLQAEQLRLQAQHQLVAELISSSTPV